MSLEFLLALILPLITVEIIKKVYNKVLEAIGKEVALALSTRAKLVIGLIVTPLVQIGIISGIIGVPVEYIQPIQVAFSTLMSQGIYNLIHELVKKDKKK